MPKVTVGSLIDHYKILEEIGKGGMGVVFKALNVNLDKQVAIKTIALGLSSDEIFLNRFRTEARALARLQDPNIVHIYDLRLDDDQWFIVMEYVDGITLARKIREEQTMPWTEALTLFKQMLSAIGHAHRVGIIHRDIKPNNVMITGEGVVKVTDFGLAKDQRNLNHTIASSTGGTLYYMSPEQVKGLQYTDFRSDIYALGLTFYEMLTGKIPFRKDDTDFTIREAIIRRQFPPPTHFVADIPPALNNIVIRAIEKKPENRFQSVDEMFEAINVFEQESGIIQIPEHKDEDIEDISSIPEPIHGISYFSDTVPVQVIPQMPRKKNKIIPILFKSMAAAVFIAAIIIMFPLFNSEEDTVPLMIVTKPEQAVIYFDQDSAGKSPFFRDTFKRGTFNLSIRKDFYLPVDTVVEVNADSLQYLAINLIPAGAITFDIYPMNAEFALNDSSYDLAEQNSFILPQGQYELRLRHPDFQPVNKIITVNQGENPVFAYNMVKRIPESFIKSASVNLNSYPAGAMVYLNNRYIGETPIINYQIQPGNINVSIRKSGYQEYNTSINAGSEQTASLDARLSPLLTTIFISSDPPGARIWFDNQPIPNRQTPVTLDSLSIGDHTVRIQKDGYREFSTPVILKHDTANKISADLKLSQGRVEISVKPWGSIYIDDRLMKKETNIKFTTSLPAGRHRIKIHHPLYGEWHKEIDLQDNQHQYIPVDFNNLVNVRVAAFDADGKPIWAEIVVDNKLTGELTPKEISVRIGQRTIAAKKDGYILVSGERTFMLDKSLEEPIKFIFKKIL